MEALGVHMGPAFPAQMPLSDDSIRRRAESFAKAGKPAAASLAGDGD